MSANQIGRTVNKMDSRQREITTRREENAHIQEAHITIGHIVCELVERELAGAE